MKKNLLLICILLMPSLVFAQVSDNTIDNDFFANAITDYINYSRKLDIYALAFQSNLEGKLVMGASGFPSDLINLKNNFNFDEELAPGFGIKWQYASRTSLHLEYLQVEHSGYLQQARYMKGKAFKANSAFNIKNRWLDIAFNKKLYRTDFETVERLYLCSVFGIKTANMIITARGDEMAALDKKVYVNWEKTFFMPYVGFKGNIRLGRNVNAKAHCLYGNFPTNSGYHVDQYDLGFNLLFDMHRKEQGNVVQLNLGYRQFEQDIDGKGNGVLFRFAGPELALNVVF